MARRRADPAVVLVHGLAAAASGERRESAVAPAGSVRIATWNVNSVKQRLPRLLPWLDERRPEVVWQENKLADDAFVDLPATKLAERQYAVALHGEPTWNGVAILSRVGLADVAVGSPARRVSPHPEARAVLVLWRDPGHLRVRTERARPGSSTTSTSSPGWLRCGTWSPLAPRRRSYVAT